MFNNLITNSTAHEFNEWTDKVNSLIKRYKKFSSISRSVGSMVFDYQLNIDGTVIRCTERQLSITLYDSEVLTYINHPGSGWVQNVLNQHMAIWLGKTTTHFNPCSIHNDDYKNTGIEVYDLIFTEETHFQHSTLYDLLPYEVCLQSLEHFHSLEINTGLLKIRPQFFHEEVYVSLDNLLYGYDK